MVIPVAICPPPSKPATQVRGVRRGPISNLNATHFPTFVDRDEIKRQMLTQWHGYLHPVRHQVTDDLSEPLVTFVFRVMSHPIVLLISFLRAS
jgi:hypothetical protein